jgi:hypothetical protein
MGLRGFHAAEFPPNKKTLCHSFATFEGSPQPALPLLCHSGFTALPGARWQRQAVPAALCHFFATFPALVNSPAPVPRLPARGGDAPGQRRRRVCRQQWRLPSRLPASPDGQVRKAFPDQAAPPAVADSTIVCSYLLCFLIPIAGLGAGIYLLIKERKTHGYMCVAISLLWMMLLFGALSSL